MIFARRRSPRLSVSIPVEWSESGVATRCRSTVEQLAGGGLFVRTALPAEPGKAVNVELLTERGPFFANGIVAWSRPGHGMGIAIPE
jgi:hypothetical protein